MRDGDPITAAAPPAPWSGAGARRTSYFDRIYEVPELGQVYVEQLCQDWNRAHPDDTAVTAEFHCFWVDLRKPGPQAVERDEKLFRVDCRPGAGG